MTCPVCGGPGVFLGQLGRRTHLRCRDCGATFSEPAGDVDERDEGLDIGSDLEPDTDPDDLVGEAESERPTTAQYIGETPGGQFRAEIVTRGETAWASNSLRFDTRDHAEDYAGDLARRWMLVVKWRAVAIATPERQRYVDGTEDGSW